MIALHTGEQVVIHRHRYWLPMALEAVAFIAAALVPFGAAAGLPFLPAGAHETARTYGDAFLFLAFTWVLIVWILFFVAWTNYHLDVLVVTNERVIDIEQKGLFSRDIAELRIENIQDMRVEVAGVLASILKFGNIHIQSAGATKEFIIEHVHNPEGIKDTIAHLLKNVARG